MTQVEHAPTNGYSPLFDGQLTSVPPFAPGLKPDEVLLIGGGSSDVTFANRLIKVTNRLGVVRSLDFIRVVPESIAAMSYKQAVAMVISHKLTVDPLFSGGKIGLIIRRFLGGVKDQSPQEIPYFIDVPAGFDGTDTDIMNALRDRINRDPNRIVDAAVVQVASSSTSSSSTTSSSTTYGPTVPKLTLTSRVAGDYFDSVRGRRLTTPVVETANTKLTLDGSFMQAIGAGLTDADNAPSKQYRGIKLIYREFVPFAGAGLFRGGRAENNSQVYRRATIWIVAEVGDADGTTKLNAIRTILTGGSTPAKNYYTITDIVAFS